MVMTHAFISTQQPLLIAYKLLNNFAQLTSDKGLMTRIPGGKQVSISPTWEELEAGKIKNTLC